MNVPELMLWPVLRDVLRSTLAASLETRKVPAG